jgi:hypothetical protein
MRERKRILRLLIEDVTLLRDRAIQVAIRWKGGATTTVERAVPFDAPSLRRTPTAIVEMIRALATEHTDREIADTLNRRWLRSGTGQPFRRLVVRHIRNAYGIQGLTEHLRKAGWLTAAEIATLLRLHSSTAKCWAARASSTLCAPMTKASSSSNPQLAHFLHPNRANDSATVAAIPSVRRMCGKRCSMKPEPSARGCAAP